MDSSFRRHRGQSLLVRIPTPKNTHTHNIAQHNIRVRIAFASSSCVVPVGENTKHNTTHIGIGSARETVPCVCSTPQRAAQTYTRTHVEGTQANTRARAHDYYAPRNGLQQHHIYLILRAAVQMRCPSANTRAGAKIERRAPRDDLVAWCCASNSSSSNNVSERMRRPRHRIE